MAPTSVVLRTMAAVVEPASARRASWNNARSLTGGIDRVPVVGLGGDLWLCGKHLIGPDHEAVLRQVAPSLVVCLNQAHEITPRYPAYARWLGGGDPRALWWPVPDLGAPPVEEADELTARIVGALDAGDDVVVHCGAGIGRAGTVAAGVLMRTGLTQREALELVAASRRLAGPEAGPQRDLLDALERRWSR